MENFSFLGNAGSNYIEDIYLLFKKIPNWWMPAGRLFLKDLSFRKPTR